MKTRTTNLDALITCVLLIVSLLFFANLAMGQKTDEKKWAYSVGLGMASAPSYIGDDEYQLLLLPNFSARYSDKFYFSLLEGIGYNVIRTGSWRIGAIIKNNIGRYEDGTVPFSISGNKTNDLNSLGDVEVTIEPGALVEFTKGWSVTKLEVRQGIGGHKGLIGEFSTQYRNSFKFNKKDIYYAVGPEVKFSDSRFNNAFFGISQEQSENADLQTYQADFGILSIGINGSFIIPINERLSTMAFVSYSRLSDTATDSSLIRKHGSAHQGALGFMLSYTL